MVNLEVNPNFVHQKVRSGEIPQFLPRVEYKGTPQEYKLPYEVKVDTEKLALFMKGIGVPEDKIRKVKITINYKPDFALGHVNLLTGNAVMGVGMIQRKALNQFNDITKELDNKVTFGDKIKKLNHRLNRFLAKEMFHELKEKGLSDSIHSVDKKNVSDLRTIANGEGVSPETAKQATEQYLKNIIDENMRLVFPHELIHVKQQKQGEMLRKAIMVLPINIVANKALSEVVDYMRMQSNNLAERYGNKAGIASRLGIATGKTYANMKIIYFTRKWMGMETEAYKNMKHYNELFSEIVKVESSGVSMDDALTESMKTKNMKRIKQVGVSKNVQMIGSFDASSKSA
ncbi:hypothetical protein KBC80_00835 [Candidatus Woesebacteria bacterium]|nr:hypothetical protein [Candidatus Woesebacteria bacterium]